MLDNDHVLCGAKNLLSFSRFFTRGKELKLLTSALEQLLLVLATNSIIICPIDKTPVQVLQLAPSERISFDFKGDILFCCTKTGSPFTDFSINVFFFLGLRNLDYAKVCQGWVG